MPSTITFTAKNKRLKKNSNEKKTSEKKTAFTRSKI